MKKYLVDTNVLLNNPEVMEKYNVVITSHVLREIEHLERTRRSDKTLQWEIRRAKRYMDEMVEDYFDLKDYKFDLSEDFSKDYVDNILIQAAVDNNYGFITNDRLLRSKAKMYNLELVHTFDHNKDVYQGYEVVVPTDEELAKFYASMGFNHFDLLTNQYLILRDENGKTIDKYRWNGDCHMPLARARFSKKKDEIKPQNDLQECAFDMMVSRDMTVKFLLGTYGSGKTFIATKFGLYHMNELGTVAKIMMIRNPIGTGEGVGYLPGDLDEKTEGFFEPIIQHLEGGQQEADILVQQGKLLKKIPYYMKGLSVDDTLMLVDEAEDLNEKMIKLVGTRIGKGTMAMFTGDVNQAEDKFLHDNGLVRAVEALKGKDKVGILVLDLDVRSEESKLFADI